MAAVDVAKALGVVCTRVPREGGPGGFVTKVWPVDATTNAILELAEHLVGLRIEKVVLESTSGYWRPFFCLLEAAGLDVALVNARDVKNAPGWPKTDLLTEPSGISAVQARCASHQVAIEMPGRSESPGCCSLAASPNASETGHTRLNQSGAFSSLPIFDVSRNAS